ncbi:metallophosphoesterase family protein [Anaerosporobacter faecicola]|uniref:metallophosphoesterase family protein n=1 Tax=Anaerosporobacter faecicola TaxID=2718714 RepID=UPI00143AD440|nr:DNA repair exonuclease [Anaerosporobacter faecicola]
MRFIHLADVHLGMQPDLRRDWSKERGKEIWKTFENVINRCEEEQIDLLLIAGDLFHKQPLLRELKEVNYLFGRLTKTHVVLMAGNHDYISHTSNYLHFPWNARVHMFEQEQLTDIYIEELNTRIYGLSYCNRDITESKYDISVLQNQQEIRILLAHGGDEKDIPMDFRKMQSLGYHYIALGHIHKPAKITGQMAYAGSLEPLDKTEIGEHGYVEGEITESEIGYQTSIRFVPFSQRQYRLLTIEGNPTMTQLEWLDTIKECMRSQGLQHTYLIVLEGARDPEITLEEEEILSLGRIIEVSDQTVPDYDFEALQRENQDNIIGMFIDQVNGLDYEDDIINQALFLGVKALMKLK